MPYTKKMTIEDLGYNRKYEKYIAENKLENFSIGRVIAEHKERYIVISYDGECEAEITGYMRFSARSREDFPTVGDWVAINVYEHGFAIIHKILPRFSVIKRQAVSRTGEIQVIAANIDYAFIVQAVDRDFNINRLERYLTICNSANVIPIIILTKIDLIDNNAVSEKMEMIDSRIKDVAVIPISNKTQKGYETIKKIIEKGKTYCLLGSSGVGKSTLINNLSGKDIMKTGTLSASTSKGRHVTSHRELIILEDGGILIDNPGMREVGITDITGGLENTFEKIMRLSKQCKFKNCTHINETGCSVLEALEKGEIERSSYENFLKMERERTHFESTIAERRKKDKGFGKMMKDYKKRYGKK